MARLVDDLLTLARVDSGQAPLHLQRLDISALINSTDSDLQALAMAREGTITVAVEPAIEAWVDGDRMRQLIVILVDNALHHGQRGGNVEVRAARVGNDFRLEVADHGPGIPINERVNVLERFYQLDGSRSAAGAGLGLSIAHWIVVEHRGNLKLLDNNPGLKVEVTLPAAGPGLLGRADEGAAPLVTRRRPDEASTT